MPHFFGYLWRTLLLLVQIEAEQNSKWIRNLRVKWRNPHSYLTKIKVNCREISLWWTKCLVFWIVCKTLCLGVAKQETVSRPRNSESACFFTQKTLRAKHLGTSLQREISCYSIPIQKKTIKNWKNQFFRLSQNFVCSNCWSFSIIFNIWDNCFFVTLLCSPSSLCYWVLTFILY